MRRFLFLPLAFLVACGDSAEVAKTEPTTTDTAGSGQGGNDGSGATEDTGSAEGSGSGEGSAQAPAPRTVTLWDNARITSDGSQPNFQNVRATADWGTGPFERVTLVMELDSTCFPFTRWFDDRPPAGQNWPPLCDAFDRNYEVTLDDPESPDALPAIELVRAITPFGGPLRLEVDVTDIANGLPGSHRFRTHITTYADGAGQVSGSNGGWNVTGRLEIQDGPAPRNVLAVIPLYNGNYPEPYDQLDFPFVLPAGTTRSEVQYRVTGHGGTRDDSSTCIGPAEEFCKRYHHVLVDGAETVYRPWRDDCDTLCTETTNSDLGQPITFCLENPMGSIASVRAPRANWCPGSETPPRLFDVASPTAGAHQFGFFIESVAQSGGWRVSAVAVAYGD